jgi:hypothetical protein
LRRALSNFLGKGWKRYRGRVFLIRFLAIYFEGVPLITPSYPPPVHIDVYLISSYLDVDLNVVEEIWNHKGRFGTTGIGANLTFPHSKD